MAHVLAVKCVMKRPIVALKMRLLLRVVAKTVIAVMESAALMTCAVKSMDAAVLIAIVAIMPNALITGA